MKPQSRRVAGACLILALLCGPFSLGTGEEKAELGYLPAKQLLLENGIAYNDPLLEEALMTSAMERWNKNPWDEGVGNKKDLEKILTLELVSEAYPVEDLSVLQFCDELETLVLRKQKVKSLAPLALLKNLKTLVVDQCGPVDLEPLGRCKALETVTLNGENITDIGFAAEARKLSSLTLGEVAVSDLSPLREKKGLAAFHSDTPFADCGPLATVKKLESLALCGLAPDQLSALAPEGLQALRQLSVTRGGLSEKDLTAIAASPKLESLRLANIEGSPNLAPLGASKTLTALSLCGFAEGADLSALPALEGLTALELRELRKADLSQVEAAERLKSLTLDRVEAGDFSPVAKLEGLTELAMTSCRLPDDSFLMRMASDATLETVRLCGLGLSDVGFLDGWTAVTRLSLNDNQIKSLEPLRKMARLTELSVFWNPIASFTPITRLKRLELLQLSPESYNVDLTYPLRMAFSRLVYDTEEPEENDEYRLAVFEGRPDAKTRAQLRAENPAPQEKAPMVGLKDAQQKLINAEEKELARARETWQVLEQAKGGGPVEGLIGPDGYVLFSSEPLKVAFRTALGLKKKDEITPEQMAAITTLDIALPLVNDKVDLTPLMLCKNLEAATFSQFRILSLGPLSMLPHLESMEFSLSMPSGYRGTVNCYALPGFPALSHVGFQNCMLMNTSYLTSSPTIQSVRLNRTEVDDMRAFAFPQGVKSLDINQEDPLAVEKISGLKNLEALALYSEVTDLESIAKLPLKSLGIPLEDHRWLTLLPQMAGLEEVRLTNGYMTAAHVAALKQLPALRKIALESAYLPGGGAFLKELPLLTDVRVLRPNGFDLTNLQNCTQLEQFQLVFQKKNTLDLAPLQALPSLAALTLGQATVKDMNVLQSFQNLAYLDLSTAAVKSLKPLEDCPSLRTLVVGPKLSKAAEALKKKLPQLAVEGGGR